MLSNYKSFFFLRLGYVFNNKAKVCGLKAVLEVRIVKLPARMLTIASNQKKKKKNKDFSVPTSYSIYGWGNGNLAFKITVWALRTQNPRWPNGLHVPWQVASLVT